MSRNAGGVYSKPSGTTPIVGDDVDPVPFNLLMDDIATDLNTPRPIVAGGTGASSAATALVNLGLTATAAEINGALDGITATAAELNILDGVTATAAELNILDGVTATAAELNALDGITATATELNALDGVTATGTNVIRAADAAAARTAVGFNDGLNASGSAPLYAARAWVDFTGATGAVVASGNVSSVTRSGAGQYTVNFTTNLPTTSYIPTVLTNGGTIWVAIGTKAVGSCVVNTRNNSGALIDPGAVYFAVIGG